MLLDNFQYKECSMNEHLFRVRVNEQLVDPYYVFGFLFSQIGQLSLKREITGGAQGGIAKPAVEKVLIPIPPKDVQRKIKEEIKNTLEKVFTLDRDVLSTLESFKKD